MLHIKGVVEKTTKFIANDLRSSLFLLKFRSSRPWMFFNMAVLKNFESFTGKHLCRIPFLIKLQGRRPVTLLKRDSNTAVFFL